MSTMRIPARLGIALCLMLLLGSLAAPAWAVPTAEFRYLETDLGGGTFQYDYTLFNTSDPILDAGFDVFDVTIFFDPGATFVGLGLPAGWNMIDGPGFAEAFSLTPGPPPGGSDVSPGASLGGFAFQFDFTAGNLPFEVLFTNPVDPPNPVVFAGTTAPVPEPSTLLLMGAGLAGMAVGLRRHRAADRGRSGGPGPQSV